jgi:hypothetical protein
MTVPIMIVVRPSGVGVADIGGRYAEKAAPGGKI